MVFKTGLSFLTIPINWIEHKSRTLYCVFEVCSFMSVKHELLSRVPWVCAEKNVEVGMGDLSVSSTLTQEVPPKKPWMSTAFYPFNECLVKAKTPCGNKWFKVINVVYRQEWRRKWQPTPVFLPRKSHGWRGLVGYSLWGCKKLDMTKQLTHTHTDKKALQNMNFILLI